jgi:hypothetical protein
MTVKTGGNVNDGGGRPLRLTGFNMIPLAGNCMSVTGSLDGVSPALGSVNSVSELRALCDKEVFSENFLCSSSSM